MKKIDFITLGYHLLNGRYSFTCIANSKDHLEKIIRAFCALSEKEKFPGGVDIKIEFKFTGGCQSRILCFDGRSNARTYTCVADVRSSDNESKLSFMNCIQESEKIVVNVDIDTDDDVFDWFFKNTPPAQMLGKLRKVYLELNPDPIQSSDNNLIAFPTS